MENEVKRASIAHERVMINLSVFHLLLPVAALSSGYVALFLTIALIGSAVMIFLIAHKASQITGSDLVKAHWQLAWKRCRLLIIAYGISMLIMLLGWGLASLQSDPNMYGILLVVFSRIAAVPTVLMVLILFVLSTSSLAQARQSEIPTK